MADNSTKITEIITAFEKWFLNDNHSKIEDFYLTTLTLENISKLSQKEFEDFFFEFAKHGGKIQSGGARTANKFIQNLHNNYEEFKQKVLEPFRPNFDVIEWLRWSESFKFFGKGLATIYLNRVDKRKYAIVNNKSIDAYKKLGYHISSSPLETTYKNIFDAQTDLINQHPVLNNYFRADALSHFLIATPEGLAVSKTDEINIPKVRIITKDNVEKAIANININPSLRKGRESIEYDLVYNNAKYPPILVLSEANKITGGQELLLSDFGNSTINAFSILQTLGFKIERKTMNFSEQLVKFLAQSESGELTTSGYITQYEDFKVKLGFGQGNQARITWIAFLANEQTVSNGIYPVYLYFKKNKLLILAYGVSENNRPAINWSIPNLKSINEYFKENKLDRPDRYGTSYVFKTYNTLNPLNPEEVNKDLNEIIELYKQDIGKQSTTLKTEQEEFNYRSFNESTDSANLLLDKDLVLRFISALLTKPFVILTGLSGSGKTKLAQAFSKWICESEDQICLVPVGADWTNREPLLGFPSALEKGRYILPENGVLSLILEASKEMNKYKPYFLILDEMNLSHVERYFADFLSAMESGDQIPLHSSISNSMNNGEIPASICIPKNLFIIGTVNIDETTYMFSPKVLDRASVIEFRVSHEEMNKYLTTTGHMNLNSIEGLGSSMASSFLEISQSKDLTITNKVLVSSSLLKFFSELKKVGAEFGYRSASEIMRFSSIIEFIDPTWETNAIIDASIMQKLLPKVHGSRRKLEPVLKTLALLCLKEEFKNGNGFKIESLLNSEGDLMGQENISYPVSFEKIKRMYRRLIDNGFTSYAEA
jgi:5-methylcytosine-specific restriction enzyme B